MVGISLSMCVKDICEGKINLCDVENIYAGTAFRSPDEAIAHYTQSYWREYPDAAEKICKQLWAEGRIIQSRLFPGVQQSSFKSRLCPVMYHRTPWYPDVDSLKAGQLEDGNRPWVELVFPEVQVKEV